MNQAIKEEGENKKHVKTEGAALCNCNNCLAGTEEERNRIRISNAKYLSANHGK